MDNAPKHAKHTWLERVRAAFRYDTDPKNSSSIMQNHITSIFDGFYLILILLLLVICGAAFLGWHFFVKH
jgi:hypothetical protein